MPVNEPKPQPKPEEILAEIFTNIFGTPATPTVPTVDPMAEINRLLKKAEEVPHADLLQIVDRHIRIVELALAYQK